MEYRLNKFNPAEAKKNRIWLIVGPRGSGKSILLKDLLYQTRQHYHFPLAFTATTSTVQTFREFLPDALIYKHGYDYQTGDRFLDQCKKITAAGKQKNALLVLDDCAYDTKLCKSEAMTEIHLNGRHSNITLFNTTQYCMTLPPLARSNVDYVCVLQDSVLANRKKLYEYFFGSFASFADFDRVMRQTTAENGCLILDKTQTSANVSDTIFYYKAKTNLPKFQIGNPIFFVMDKVVKQKQLECKSNVVVTVPAKR